MHLIFNDGAFLFSKKRDAIANGAIVNIYIVFRLSSKTISSSIVLKNGLFGATKITNRDAVDGEPQKYKYPGYGIAFDRTSQFTHPDESIGRNVVIFGVDMSNSKHANNKTKTILVLGHVLTQKIDDTTIYAEKMYSPNFIVENKTFCLSLHFNGDDCYLFVNGTEVTKFKAKISEINAYPLLLGNIAIDANGAHTNKYIFQPDTALYGNVYDFSVDYSAITNDKILDIHTYLMEKNGIV